MGEFTAIPKIVGGRMLLRGRVAIGTPFENNGVTTMLSDPHYYGLLKKPDHDVPSRDSRLLERQQWRRFRGVAGQWFTPEPRRSDDLCRHWNDWLSDLYANRNDREVDILPGHYVRRTRRGKEHAETSPDAEWQVAGPRRDPQSRLAGPAWRVGDGTSPRSSGLCGYVPAVVDLAASRFAARFLGLLFGSLLFGLRFRSDHA